MNRKETHSRLLTFLAILYVSIATFSTYYGVVQPGLDESWMYALNQLHVSSYIFGADVICNYGPLGFLMRPRAIGNNLAWAACFEISVQVLLAAVCLLFSRRRRGFLLFLAGLFIAQILGLWEEYYYRILLALFLLAGCLESGWALPMCAIAGLAAVFLLLIKFSLGIASLALLAMWVVVLFLVRPSRMFLRLAILSASFAASLAIAIGAVFHGTANFLRWFELSVELAKGYGSATSVAGPILEAALGITLAVALPGAAIFIRGALRYPAILFSLAGLVALKHGFTGDTTYASGFFTFAVAIISIFFLYCESTRQFRIVAAVFFTVSAIAILKGTVWTGSPPLTITRVLDYVTLKSGVRDLKDAIKNQQTAARLQSESRLALAGQRLPERWADLLKRAQNGADVMPFEYSYLPANGIPFHPSLVVQQHLAYTSRLDAAAGRYLLSDRAPGSVLVEFTGVFGRHMIFDTPDILRALLQQYRVVASDPSRNLALLSRNPSRTKPLRLAMVSRSLTAQDIWVDVPVSRERIYARIRLKPNLVGFLRDTFWKTAPVLIQTQYASGVTTEYRLCPLTTENGILANAAPATLAAFSDLFHGTVYDEVRRLRLTGPGLSSYSKPIEIEWVTDHQTLANGESGPVEVTSAKPIAESEGLNLVVAARNPAGARKLAHVQAIINHTFDGSKACYVSYEIQFQRIWLMNDSGAGAAGQGLTGSPEILENSTCTVNLFESYADLAGADATVHFAIEMKPSSAPAPTIYAKAIARDGAESSWRGYSKWPSDGPRRRQGERAPRVTVETKPLDGASRFGINVQVSDLNGIHELEWAQVIVNGLMTGDHGCYVHYDAKNRALFLMNDGATAYVGSASYDKGGAMHNSYCGITVRPGALEQQAYRLEFQFEAELSPKMNSKHNVFASAANRNGMRQNFGAAGSLSGKHTDR